MKTLNKDLEYLFKYIIFSAVFFLLGLTTVISLPKTSQIYLGLLKSFYEIKPFYAENKELFDVSLLISLFYCEIKHLLFIFLSSLCIQKEQLLIVANSYKGLISGIGCSLFVRIIAVDTNTLLVSLLVSVLYITTSVISVYISAKYSASSIKFSKRIVFPIKLKTLFKRKDTYNQLSELLVFCGILFILTLLKIFTLLYAV